jgi:argininosuccinate lyase
MKAMRTRFRRPLAIEAEAFLSSSAEDGHLFPYDIQGSIAHARMLQTCGLITAAERSRIVAALKTIQRKGISASEEDVHLGVEQELRRISGGVADKLHTGRSRNDQVALDLRLYVIDAVRKTVKAVKALQKTLQGIAAKHRNSVMPGMTHLQPAQPVTFARALLSYVEKLKRDSQRLSEIQSRAAVSPLGAGALAGSTLPIDPKVSARYLRLPKTFENSIDAVEDRDFAVEFVFACAVIQTHLSQMAENLLLWSAPQFGFVELSDSVTTTSSMMPQKKNADVLELVRAKTGILNGALIQLLTVLKGLPGGYNRDLQETKPPVFAAAETVSSSLQVMKLCLSTAKIHHNKMEEAARDEFLYATDIAEALVKKGIPFRKAHQTIAALVRDCLHRGIPFSQAKTPERLTRAEYLSLLDPHEAIRRRGTRWERT